MVLDRVHSRTTILEFLVDPPKVFQDVDNSKTVVLHRGDHRFPGHQRCDDILCLFHCLYLMLFCRVILPHGPNGRHGRIVQGPKFRHQLLGYVFIAKQSAAEDALAYVYTQAFMS